jgi:putative molybdopterin biosynthesis protein
MLTGTLDPALEELALLAQDEGLFIHATNPGNIAGLRSLAKDTCHAAPLSLPAHSLLRSYEPLITYNEGPDLAFIHLATMELGITSRDGLDIGDLPHAKFINTRQGTPSRSILDGLLKKEGINPAQVDGYLLEVHGPQAVAAAILNGFADAGICTSGIAVAEGLRFVPVAHEDYELVVRREMVYDPRISTLVSLVTSPRFQAILQKKGGYDLTLTGIIRRLDSKMNLAAISPGNLQ